LGDDAALLTAWADVVIARLVGGGVRHLVVSPGSRSTAYVLAGHRHPQLVLHDVVDERSAAFFALGMARATGEPAALLCTSGTAPAHYLPAVIEATRSRLPLVVLSADRPLELVGCEAPQAIDQVKLFGDHVVHYADLGTPQPAAAALRGVARAVSQAVAATRWPVPGAVHLNARARKPFEPGEPSTEEGRALVAAAQQLCAWHPRVHVPRVLPDEAALDEVAARLSDARSGLILAGPAPVDAHDRREPLVALARATGFPVYAEATSQLRWGDRADDVAWVDALDLAAPSLDLTALGPPEVVVEVGQPLVAGSHGRAIEALGAERIVLSDGPWADWLGSARTFLLGDVRASLDGLARRLEASHSPHTSPPHPWFTAMSHASDVARSSVEQRPGSDGAAVASLARHVPAGTRWLLGNSLAVRLVDWFGDRSSADPVLHQRGANGIDGLIAGAAGAAVAAGGPTLLLLGDVATWHDIGSLRLARHSPHPLVVVVLHNGGGRIFDLLPVAHHPDVSDAERAHLCTPDDEGFDGVTALFGVRHRRVPPTEAGPAAAEALATPGCTLLEVRTRAHGTAELLRTIRAALASDQPPS